MVELLVVIVILGILGAAALPSLNAPRKASSSTTTTIAANAVWRAILMYRVENQGVFPLATEVVPSTGTDYGAGLVVPGTTRRYIDSWPTDVNGNKMLIATALPTAPATIAPLPSTTGASPYGSNRLVYAVQTDRTAAWIAAYNASGKLVFRRSVNTGATAGAPVG